ncbi:MAG: tetratricopeptide repeat protein [Deltaproteobacteria bacterium]|nr:tetratricopeptide repeat protein [Deltaproteobacteria bacterium]
MIESVSFCVLNCGQPGKDLKECIEGIRRQGAGDYEILVNSRGLEKEPDIKYIDTGDCPGLDDAAGAGINRMRNILCAGASKGFIVLIDAGVELLPDWYRHISASDYFDLIGTRLTDPGNRRVMDWAYKVRLNGKSFALPLDYDEWNPAGFINASLMVMRWGVFEKVRFNEDISKGQEAEEAFCIAAGKEGFRVGVCKEAGAILRERVFTFDESISAVSSYREAFSRGHDAFSRRDWEDALRHYEKAVIVNPCEVSTWSRMGWSHYFLRRFGEAVPPFTEALKLSPGFKDALLGRGWAHSEQGDYEAAIKDLSEAIAGFNEEDGRDLLQQLTRGRGWAYFRKNDFKRAIEDFEKALEHTDPGCGDVLQDIYRGLGWASYKNGSFARSKEYFDMAVENIGPNHGRALLEDALRGSELSCGSLVGVLESSQNNGNGRGGLMASFLSGMGRQYYLKSNLNEALSKFNEAIRLRGKAPRALSGRGWVWIEKGMFDRAIDDFNMALEYRDEMNRQTLQETFRGRGWAYYRKGKFLEAVEDFKTAIGNTKADDAFVLRHILRGRSWAYYRLGKIEEAIEDLRRTGVNILPLLSYRGFAKRFLGLQVAASSIKQQLKKIIIKDSYSVNI